MQHSSEREDEVLIQDEVGVSGENSHYSFLLVALYVLGAFVLVVLMIVFSVDEGRIFKEMYTPSPMILDY